MVQTLPILLSELHGEILPLPLELIMMLSTTTSKVEGVLDPLLGMIYLALLLVASCGSSLAQVEATLCGVRLGDLLLLLLSELLAFHQ